VYKGVVPIDARLAAMLRCPSCRQEVRVLENDAGIACTACGLVYPIVDGIPVMLVEEARRGDA
jgi:uncharacterized protein YbaR (Trm112 family)